METKDGVDESAEVQRYGYDPYGMRSHVHGHWMEYTDHVAIVRKHNEILRERDETIASLQDANKALREEVAGPRKEAESLHFAILRKWVSVDAATANRTAIWPRTRPQDLASSCSCSTKRKELTAM